MTISSSTNNPGRRAIAAVIAALVAVCAPAALAPAAHAGTWAISACQNPDGSPAPSEGWSASTAGGGAPTASAQCTTTTPMKAVLSDLFNVAAPVGSSATLTFTPPAGSTLVGGIVNASLYAGGYTGGTLSGGAANAELDTPALSDSDAFTDCNAIVATAGCNNTYQVAGQFSLPGDAGGGLYARAACNGTAGYACNTRGGGDNAWADAEIHFARLTLSSTESPQGTGFSGSATARRVSGDAHLVFTASVPTGPGVYDIQTELDGRPVWSSAPNAGDPSCNPVASTPATPMVFDSQQPCPLTETVDASVPTSGLPDGRHELAVLVTDAAGNQATVYDQNIATSNPQTTPNPRGTRALHARFVINWTWGSESTRIDRVTITHLPRRARITAHCAGRRCPRLRVRSASSATIGRLLRALDGRRLPAGDSLYLTVSAPGRRPERVRLRIRSGARPEATLTR